MILIVDQKDVLVAWGLIHKYIEAACNTNPLQAPEMVLANLLTGKAQLWILADGEQYEGAMVTEAVTYPNGLTVANIWALGGETGVWQRHEKDLENVMDAWSAAQGCDIIALLGRPGWQKALGSGWQSIPLVQAWRPRNVHNVSPPAVEDASQSGVAVVLDDADGERTTH